MVPPAAKKDEYGEEQKQIASVLISYSTASLPGCCIHREGLHIPVGFSDFKSKRVVLQFFLSCRRSPVHT